MDASEPIAQLAAACNGDIIEAARSKNEMIYVYASIGISLTDAFQRRDFRKCSQLILKYPESFCLQGQQAGINEFGLVYFGGLVSFHMARETRDAHWVEKGNNALATFEKWSSLNEWNFEHRYLLLKAESHQTKGDANAASQAYELAADAAKKHCFINQVALVCEFAGHYFKNIGSKERMKEMFQKSYDAYVEWGALAKANSISNLLLPAS